MILYSILLELSEMASFNHVACMHPPGQANKTKQRPIKKYIHLTSKMAQLNQNMQLQLKSHSMMSANCPPSSLPSTSSAIFGCIKIKTTNAHMSASDPTSTGLSVYPPI
mmetsp:Transcript_28100/g.59683  ORF Transcript_28100/g.59683 Transcript_28100/m.59683 type:complete len:109 (+) Transcript_28100:121-447(+)